MITDRISDTLVRVKNASNIKNKFVLIPYTKLNFQILNSLKNEKLISNFEITRIKKVLYFNVELEYKIENSIVYSFIKDIKRISKPSLRVYVKAKHLKNLFYSRETYFISTSKGILTNKVAYKKNIGGELLFSIYLN